MDIKPPPKKMTQRYISDPLPKNTPVSTPQPLPVKPVPTKRSWPWKWIVIGLGALVLMLVTAIISWYAWALQPYDAYSKEQIRISVKSGDTTSTIAQTLKSAGVVRSATAFRVYAELSRTKNQLQAGGYIVSPAQSVSDIINHLVSGKTDELTITIPPGVSLLGIREVLQKYGYSDQEITAAFNAGYDSPLLADKPTGASIDGYLFPETFKVDPNDSLQELFGRSFDELYTRLQSDGMIEKFKARNLNIHQALTLASIIQKEESDPADQRQVAQVFFLRLAQGMPLESDPTFIYAANQLGVEPSVNIDSPYNTRKYAGLPPTPIANMNYSAIEAVTNPAAGNYLYFVAGDDGVTHFSYTLEQHIENVKKYCTDLCN